MLFSEKFAIRRCRGDKWFDPILELDTGLFLDPFLIYKTDIEEFSGAHDKVINFFNFAFRLGAESQGIRRSAIFLKLRNMLTFPEVSEICLGYAQKGTQGAGSGRVYSRNIANALLEALSQGITKIEHFEQIPLITEGIGCDRISDITANILKREIIEYTIKIIEKHNIKTFEQRVYNSDFNWDFLRWEHNIYSLPRNDDNRKPILLVPEDFLNNLPTINSGDFWDYLWDHENERVRRDFDFDVKRSVNKKDLIQYAKENGFLVRRYLKFVRENYEPTPYDVIDDPLGEYQWYPTTSKFVANNPVSLIIPNNISGFKSLIKEIIEQYRIFIELNNGYTLLWNDKLTKPRKELLAQRIFLALAKGYCEGNDIDVSKEPDIGSGAVDFKFSSGYKKRVLIEIKLARNSRWASGLEKQLPRYLEAEDIDIGFFVVICYSLSDFNRVSDIQGICDEVGRAEKKDLEVVLIDATPDKRSASNL